MKAKRLIAVILSLVLISGCNESIPSNETPPQTTAHTQSSEPPTLPTYVTDPLSPEKQAGLNDVIADFTVGLFKRAFAEAPDENSLVSPLSVMLALTVTANGADNDTLSEMSEVLTGNNIIFTDFTEWLAVYAHNLPSGEGALLNIANLIWYRDSAFEISEDFLLTAAEYFSAQIEGSDFDEKTLKDINAWVKAKTDGMTDKILDRINPLDVMYLINAIAFDAEWAKPYTEFGVRKGDFTAIDGSAQEAEFMDSLERVYIETDNATGFVKPYKNHNYSFAALLPNEEVSITDFVAEMSGAALLSALSSTAYEGVQASMPKFSFDYKITMNGILAEMGMPTAFEEADADFTRLGKSHTGNIFIDAVMHKTFIEVNEAGTRAVAVTCVAMGGEDGGPDITKTVILDRPFVFAIIDNATALPIFIGALTEIPN
jgi:serpin B